MAQGVVSVAIKTIADLLAKEGSFLYKVREEVERLPSELKCMHSFFKDADNMQEGNERVRNWVSEVRDIAYDAEDVIETYIFKASRSQLGVSMFKRFVCTITNAYVLHEIGTKIRSLRTRLDDISKGMQTFGIKFVEEGEGSCLANEMRRQLRRSYPHDEEEHVISFEGCTQDLRTQLMIDDDRLRVVSVVGMGGLGKTTLAKKVYNHSDVRRHFDFCCWVFISQQFSQRDVLFDILRQVVTSKEEQEKLEKMKAEEMVPELSNLLKDRRYLVVLDDIWSKQAWSNLKPAFPKGKSGSKVLFTTRNKDVASHADPRSSPIEPPLLTNEESWILLSKKAFSRDVDKHHIPPEFENMGKYMVKKCGGLPLAVVVLGGLLATKKTVYEWELVQRNINVQFNKLEQQQQYAGVYGILGLSYQSLPFYLKPCFLYLSQFPEDFKIPTRKIIRMWIAEGFIHGDEEDAMEAEGENYLDELVRRCMIQVSQKDHTRIGVKSFRMHDLMRDVCVSKAKEENFLRVEEHRGVINFKASSSSSLPLITTSTKSRRIAVHCREDKLGASLDIPIIQGNNYLRSLFYFGDETQYYTRMPHIRFAFKNFMLLRVLNLQFLRLGIGKIPNEIGNLIYLRYLGLKDGVLERVPASISNMRRLYTLDMQGCFVNSFSNVLWKLDCLRHLIFSGIRVFFQTHCRVDTLQHLETLKGIEAKDLIRKQAVQKLANLQNLVVQFEKTEEVEEILNSPIISSGRLRCLGMGLAEGISFQNLKPLSNCQHLTKLCLVGGILEDASSLDHSLKLLPKSLAKLTLKWSKLEQDPMPILEKLPKLRSLSLMDRSFTGSQMVCSKQGFSQLEYLKLQGLLEQEELKVEEGAMPRLESLNIYVLDKLKTIPEGLKFVTTLQELTLWGQRGAFNKRVQVIDGVEGEDFYKVRHIPSISIKEGRAEDLLDDEYLV